MTPQSTTHSTAVNPQAEAPPRLPPQDLDAEISVLGSMLLDNSAVPLVTPIVQSHDFYDPNHQAIFSAILACIAASRPADLNTVKDALDAAGKLAAVGGVDYLVTILERVPSAANAAPYAAIVLERAHRRRQIAAATQIARLAYDPTSTIEERLNALDYITRLGAAPAHSPDALDRWTLLPLAAAFEPRPPLQYLVSDFLIAGSLAVVFGPPAGKKSMLMADLAVCLGAGLAWLPSPLPTGRYSPTTRTVIDGGAAGLWCDFDNGPRLTAERLEAMARGHGVSPEGADLLWVSMADPWLNLGDPQHVDEMIRRILAQSRKVVWIDNLPVTSGGVDENTSQMIPVLVNCRRICNATGAAVVLLAHPTKDDGTARSTASRLRGHSSILAALDFCFYIDCEPASDRVVVSCAKSRYAPIADFRAEFRYEHRSASRELASASFWGIASDDDQADSALLAAVAKLELKPDSPEINGKAIIETLLEDNLDPDFRIDDDYLRGRLKLLVRERKLKESKGKRRANVYSIPAVNQTT